MAMTQYVIFEKLGCCRSGRGNSTPTGSGSPNLTIRSKTFNNNNTKGSPGALKRVQEEVEPRTPSPQSQEKQPFTGDKVDRLHVDVTLLSIEVNTKDSVKMTHFC
jgi:hypothetical protein